MTDPDTPTVFIVDDDGAVRDSIQELVESIGLQAEGHDSPLAYLDHYQPERSGCLVLDVRMSGMSGLQLQKKLNELEAEIPVIMLTGHGDIPMAVQALQNGAIDFIQKPYPDQLLLDAINKALATDANARQSLRDMNSMKQRLDSLTVREREVLDFLVEAGTAKEIARELGISPRTAEAHRHHILTKLAARSIKDLMPYRKLIERKVL